MGRGGQTPATYALRKWTPCRSRVAAGAVVVLSGAGVGVAGEDLGVNARGRLASRALVIAACRSECGLMCWVSV